MTAGENIVGDKHVLPFAAYELGIISAKISQVRATELWICNVYNLRSC
jgi:hypothetical protein